MKQTFKKEERLSGHTAIELLFSNGRQFYEYPFKVLYKKQLIPMEGPKAQILVVVPKRYFKKAVDRNLMKRRIREVYRKQKEDFYASLPVKQATLAFALIYTSKTRMSYSEIEQKIVLTLRRLVKKVNELDG